jgi:hypothetical protein
MPRKTNRNVVQFGDTSKAITADVLELHRFQRQPHYVRKIRQRQSFPRAFPVPTKSWGRVGKWIYRDALSLTIALFRGEWSASRSCRFTSGARDIGSHCTGRWVCPKATNPVVWPSRSPDRAAAGLFAWGHHEFTAYVRREQCSATEAKRR